MQDPRLSPEEACKDHIRSMKTSQKGSVCPHVHSHLAVGRYCIADAMSSSKRRFRFLRIAD